MTVIAKRKNKTIYRDNDKTVKVFDKEYSKADVLNEALNQARVEETGLNIPKALEVSKIDGSTVTPKLAGNSAPIAKILKIPEKDPVNQ